MYAYVPVTNVARCLGAWWTFNLCCSTWLESNIKKARSAFFARGKDLFLGKLNPFSVKSIIECCIIPVGVCLKYHRNMHAHLSFHLIFFVNLEAIKYVNKNGVSFATAVSQAISGYISRKNSNIYGPSSRIGYERAIFSLSKILALSWNGPLLSASCPLVDPVSQEILLLVNSVAATIFPRK